MGINEFHNPGMIQSPDDGAKRMPEMDDLISRRAAIEALGEEPDLWCESDANLAERMQWRVDVTAIKTVEPATLYGYNINDLVVFAEACWKAGVEYEDLRDFSQNVSEAYRVVGMEVGKVIYKTLEELLPKTRNESLETLETLFGKRK